MYLEVIIWDCSEEGWELVQVTQSGGSSIVTYLKEAQNICSAWDIQQVSNSNTFPLQTEHVHVRSQN